MAILISMWIGINGSVPICQAMIKEGPEIIPLPPFGMDLFRLTQEHPIDGKLTLTVIGVVEVHYQVWLMQTLG